MEKYVVTVIMDGEYYPINVKAKDGLQASKKVSQNCGEAVIDRIETHKEYKERTRKFNPVMTSSYQTIKTTKRAVFGE